MFGHVQRSSSSIGYKAMGIFYIGYMVLALSTGVCYGGEARARARAKP